MKFVFSDHRNNSQFYVMKVNKYSVFIFLWFSCSLWCFSQLKVESPDENIAVEVKIGEKIYYSISYKQERIMEFSPLSITINNNQLGKEPTVVNSRTKNIHQKLYPVWGSRAEIDDYYNELIVDFEGNYTVKFRVYNKGVAYRFETDLGDEPVIVNSEEVDFRFEKGTKAWLSKEQSYETNYEETSLDKPVVDSFNNSIDKIYLPTLVLPNEKVKLLITEADLHNYPSLFLQQGNDNENYLRGTFEPYALTTKRGGYNDYFYLTETAAEYIAKVNGRRTFPWRLLIISEDDKDFVDCDLVYQLSSPSKLSNTDWIKPGKVAWEWWHGKVVEGEKFIGGVNTKTYLYHVDFAAKYGLEYILIDAGWTDKYDLTQVNPKVDIEKIVRYGKANNVNVIVWCPGHTLFNQMEEALDFFAAHGVAGVKADFFGREDQTGIEMYEAIAVATAERGLLIDFHGCTKPTGLSRTFPNIINYEAVAGNEWNRLDKDKVTIKHKVSVPFVRSAAGPMDFTPGGMRNVQSGHHLRKVLPEVHGTRANESALFVIYNEPLKMMCDAPSVYNREEKYIRFISKIPTTWDETRVLEAKFREYLVVARRKGQSWYVAGISGDNPREVSMNFSFLEDMEYHYTLLSDGPNSYRVGTDYLWQEGVASKADLVNIGMETGGGFVMVISLD